MSILDDEYAPKAAQKSQDRVTKATAARNEQRKRQAEPIEQPETLESAVSSLAAAWGARTKRGKA